MPLSATFASHADVDKVAGGIFPMKGRSRGSCDADTLADANGTHEDQLEIPRAT